MTWLNSIFISLLTGVLGLLCGGFIMNLCVSWYRVSSFEGKSGYAVITVALLSGIAGIVVGLVASRLIAGAADPGFLKGLGYASGTVVGIAVVALGLCRLNADLAPEVDGQSLELVVEIRCPQSFTLPVTLDESGATAEVYLPHGSRQPTADLRLAEATKIDGHWVVPATLPLMTREPSSKYLNVRFSKDTSLNFNLPLRSNPKKSDLEWSAWVDSGWDSGQPEPAKEAKFNARYRVQIAQPPTPAPDPAAEEAERFAALDPDAPLKDWVNFASPAGPMDRNNAVAEIVEQRQDDLAALILSTDVPLREKALLVTQYLSNPSPAVADAVLAEGRAVVDGIRKSNALRDDDPALAPTLVELSTRFNSWKRAYWCVCQRLGHDGSPIFREIHELASVRAPGTAIDEIKVNADAILEELEKYKRNPPPR